MHLSQQGKSYPSSHATVTLSLCMCFTAFFSIQQREQLISLQAATRVKANVIQTHISMAVSYLLSAFKFYI